MGIEKYNIAKEFKRGICARIQCSTHNWSEESQEFIDGYEWASKKLVDIIHNGLNEYIVKKGHDSFGIITAWDKGEDSKIE